MTNREWLNTLSDEEYADVFEPRGNTTEPYCEINYTNCPKKPRGETKWKCYDCLLPWLQAQHETTADEDFAEIGFRKAKNDTNTYIHTSQIKTVQVGRKGNGYWTKPNYPFTDSEIDQIRTIADKKRKEMGWK